MSTSSPPSPHHAPGPGDLYPWGLHITRGAAERFAIPPAPPEAERDLPWNLNRLLRRIVTTTADPLPTAAELYLLATLGDIQRHLVLAHLRTLKVLPGEQLLGLLPCFWAEYPPAGVAADELVRPPAEAPGRDLALAELFVHALQEENPALAGPLNPLNLFRASDFASRNPLRRQLEQFQAEHQEGAARETSLLDPRPTPSPPSSTTSACTGPTASRSTCCCACCAASTSGGKSTCRAWGGPVRRLLPAWGGRVNRRLFRAMPAGWNTWC